MSGATAALSVWTAAWATAIGRACWQGGLTIGLVWALCRLLPRLSGRIQCWLWRLAYLKLLVALLWTVPLELPLLTTPPASVVPAAGLANPRVESLGWLEPAALPVKRAVPAPVSKPNPAVWLLLVWLLGAGWCGGQLFLSWRRSRRLRITGVEVSDDSLLADYRALCRRLGIGPEPALLIADDLTCPVLVGVGNPAVVLPASFPSQFNPAQLRLMLAHELAHLKRRDLLWAWLPNGVRVLFFFHPLVWLAEREWRLAQEMACDEQVVLSTGASPVQYGALLLEVIREAQRELHSGLLTVGVAGSYATLKRRLVAIRRLRPASPRGRRRSATVGMVTSVLLVIGAVTGLIPWRLTATTHFVRTRVPAAQVAALPDQGSRGTDAKLESRRHELLPAAESGAPRRGVGPESERASEGMPRPRQPLRTETPGSGGARSAERQAGGPNPGGAEHPPLNAAIPDRTDGDRGGLDRRSLSVPLTGGHRESQPNGEPERSLSETLRPEGERSGAVPRAVAIAAAPSAVRENSLATGPPAAPTGTADLPDPAASPDALMKSKRAHPDASGQDPQKAVSMKSEEAPGVLRLPKPLVAPAAFIGWRRSPLAGKSNGLQVRIDRPVDPRELMKMLARVQEGAAIDPRVFKKLLAHAHPEYGGDMRALKKMLLRASQEVVTEDRRTDGKLMSLESKQPPLFDKRLDERKHRAAEARTNKVKSDPPDDGFSPGS